jgi:Fe-S cluster biogenesis protein NfuA
VLIEWRATPNPHALRFDLPVPLPLRDPVAVTRASQDPPPIAERLLQLDGVEQCLLARDFVAVTRQGDRVDWTPLCAEILSSLADSLSRPDEIARMAPDDPKPVELDGDIERQIDELLRTRVAAQVARDGGDISFVDFEDGVVTVLLTGACGGCPSAMMTLTRNVETTLMRYVPEIRQVVAKQERSGAHRDEPAWRTMLRGRGARFRDDQSRAG